MNTPNMCDTADHQFLIQEATPDDVMPLDIGHLSS